MLVHEHIVRFVGGGGEDVPETYGASLIVLAGVMPYYEDLVQRWVSARFITILTVPGLMLMLRVTFPYTFNVTPQLIQARLCRVCSFRSRTAFALIQHTYDEYLNECVHIRMPWHSVAVVHPGC